MLIMFFAQKKKKWKKDFFNSHPDPLSKTTWFKGQVL